MNRNMELLLHWMRKQEIDDKMIYKNVAIKQECFLRDQICERLLHTHAFVVSTHMSKSIILPVYAFTMENGIKVICRDECRIVVNHNKFCCHFARSVLVHFYTFFY